MSIRSRFSGSLHTMLRRFFQREIVPYDSQHFLQVRMARFLRDNKIDLVLDVGANIGQTGQELRQDGYTGRIVSFEPLSQPYAQLTAAAGNDPKWKCVNTAVGDAEGKASIHVSATSVSSSILPMNQRHIDEVPGSSYVGTETVAVTTLDLVFPSISGSAERTYLKIDVQGFELPVLRGAATTLPKMTLVQLELMPALLYEGQTKYFELMAHMDRAGFDLISIDPNFIEQRTGHFLALDAMFRRAER